MTSRDPPQLVIFHLSDIHFGRNHRFQPDPDAAGTVPLDRGFPSLFEKLKEDLQSFEALHADGTPPQLAVCITGDLTQTASHSEFREAESFIRGLADTPLFGGKLGLSRVLCIPGNHDLKYDEHAVGPRWTEYAEFYKRLFNTHLDREHPEDFAQLIESPDLAGCIFLCINSAASVVKNDVEAKRGRIDQTQLQKIDNLLRRVPAAELQHSLKIALIHHHPILIPDLVEAGSNYDAIYNSGLLLSKLRAYGFQLVLHGHKHFPVTFSDDSRSAYSSSDPIPMVVAAGGSIGSRALPSARSAVNCYNQISMKWDSSADQYRIRIETRGLDIWDEQGRPEIPALWKWKTLAIDDRHYLAPGRRPAPSNCEKVLHSDCADLKTKRELTYAATRGYFPVADVMPSLKPGVHYEAHVWLVKHVNKSSVEAPIKVTWYAGPKFQVRRMQSSSDDKFCVIFHYYGPMLVQCTLEFSDGSIEHCYIYIRRPESYSAGGV